MKRPCSTFKHPNQMYETLEQTFEAFYRKFHFQPVGTLQQRAFPMCRCQIQHPTQQLKGLRVVATWALPSSHGGHSSVTYDDVFHIDLVKWPLFGKSLGCDHLHEGVWAIRTTGHQAHDHTQELHPSRSRDVLGSMRRHLGMKVSDVFGAAKT